MHSTQRIFGVLVSAIALVHCNHRHNFYKRDMEDNGGQHLQSILKDHDIVPDILDDASETGFLEVKAKQCQTFASIQMICEGGNNFTQFLV